MTSASALRDERVARMRGVLRLERPDRMPIGDWATIEYRPDVYHLGGNEPLPEAGEVGTTRDGKRRVTRDGGVWATDAKEKYRTPEDVLSVDPEQFEVETVGPAMLGRMAELQANAARGAFPIPMHYGTLVTRATIEFGWEPFLMALALESERFARVLHRFGEASLAVVQGWAQTEGVELIFVHDDIAATRGLLLSPACLRKHVFPWYERLFGAIHAAGRKVLYVGDGNYADVVEDFLALGVDGLYVESSSMDPAEFLPRAGRDKLFLLKTDNRNIDFGTPQDLRREFAKLRELHQDFPGLMIYRGGGNPAPGIAEAFAELYAELLVYE
jgi:hypothetical protein